MNSEQCGAMVYRTPDQTSLATCGKPPGHGESEDALERVHVDLGLPGFSWYTVGRAPEGVCADSHGRVFSSGHYFGTNFTRCRICDTPQPKESAS